MNLHTRKLQCLTLLSLGVAGCATASWKSEFVDAPAPARVPSSQPVRGVAALRDALDAVFDEEKYANAFWGVRVEEAGGRVLYERNAGKGFTPASNMKIFTSAAALDILGADFRYETRLEATGTITAEGRLEGDLVIVGSGDPSLGAWHPDKTRDSRQLLADWVAKIREAGIRSIAGDILGDGRCFTEEALSPNWDYSDLAFWYAAPTSGLAIEENAFRCVIRPGAKVGDSARIELIPATSYIRIINETKTVAAGGATNADSTTHDAEGNTKRFIGTIAIDSKEVNERGAVWDGAAYAATLLKEELERQGIAVAGRAANIMMLPDRSRIDAVASDRRRRIATHTSPPMSELVKVINKPSHNFFADQILRTVALHTLNDSSFDAGAKAMQAWLKEIDAPQPEAFQMYDGSGLAKDDLVQPRQICAVLRHMRRDDVAGRAFYASLPVGGLDGTLESRLGHPATKHKVHAKTGYISNVRALSGYLTRTDGSEVIFSMICNQFTIPVKEVNASQDAAATLLATWRER